MAACGGGAAGPAEQQPEQQPEQQDEPAGMSAPLFFCLLFVCFVNACLFVRQAGAAAVTERGGEADSVCHTHYNKVDFLKTSLSLFLVSLFL